MNKSKDMVWITSAYVLAVFTGGASLYLLNQGPLLNGLMAAAITMLVIFVFSRSFKNSSFFDAYWSLIPPLLALYWLANGNNTAPPGRELLVLGMILSGQPA